MRGKKTVTPRTMPDLTTKRQSFLWGAAIISAGGFISKILGAVYRIPLTAFLGSNGMGIYQMVYPLYCILLTVAASGIPTGIARLVSSRAGGAEKSAFRLYGVIGLIGSLLMYMAAKPLSAAQGEQLVELCCKVLSPAVFFVAFLSVVRGYFQGKGNMLPTAVTEVTEQLVKVLFGCVLAYVNRSSLKYAVASALLAVTVSEILSSLLALFFYSRQSGKKPLYKIKQVSYKSILKYTVPLTLTAVAMPLSQLAESIVAVNLMRAGGLDATALYGIYSGCAVTIINLPVSLTYGLAAASVPHISPLAAQGNATAAKSKAVKSVLITFALSLPCALLLYILAPFAQKIIFRSLSAQNAALLIYLVRIMAVNAVTLSVIQTSSACLTALGYPLKSTLTQWVSCIIRVCVTAALLKFTNLSVAALAVAADCAYLLAVFINLWYIIRAGGAYENHVNRFRVKRRGT